MSEPRDPGQIEVTPAMLEAGWDAYTQREEGLGLDEDDVREIYRAMEAKRVADA